MLKPRQVGSHERSPRTPTPSPNSYRKTGQGNSVPSPPHPFRRVCGVRSNTTLQSAVTTCSVAHQSLGNGAVSSGVKRTERESVSSSLSSTEVKSRWSLFSLPPPLTHLYCVMLNFAQGLSLIMWAVVFLVLVSPP